MPSKRGLGIKNSWKYEKDLMIIFNLNLDINNISNVSDFIYIQLGNNRLIYLKRNFKKGIAKKKSA